MSFSPTASRSHDPDAELVRSCQAGGADSAHSFARLIERHGAQIHRRAARILGDDSEAEDVVQEVFMNVHRFIGRYQPDRPFGHWLSVVTLNACRIELRRRAGRDRRHEAYRTDPGTQWTTSFDGDPILREWLDQALDELPPTTRECILMRALDGYSYREVAQRSGLSEPAAKMRVLRGLRDLRSRYQLHRASRDGERLVAQTEGELFAA